MKTTELIDQREDDMKEGDLSGFCKLCIVPGEGFSGDVSELPKSLADLPFLQLP